MVTRIGPMIPGLGVNYTSPANTPRSNAVNIRQTGAASGEANRFANMAPAGTTTRPMSPPASANSALGLGERNASSVPQSLSSTRGPSPVPTLIPGALDMQGRMGGANGVPVTSTGAVRPTPTPTAAPVPAGSGAGAGAATGGAGAGGSGAGAGGSGAGSSGAASGAAGVAESAAGGETSPIDAKKALDDEINKLLNPDFIGFQGDRAAELRRLQNLRNQLFGDAEFGQTGSVQRQEKMDADGRRRLAAQRASAGMLQGGAFFGKQRGLGELQLERQMFDLQEMQRPFRDATASDRLREFGLSFDPTSRIFDQMDMDLTGFSTQTQAGREAAARAKLAAMQILAQRGSQI